MIESIIPPLNYNNKRVFSGYTMCEEFAMRWRTT